MMSASIFIKKCSESGNIYYSTAGDLMLPFVDITEEEVRRAPRPFLVNEVNPAIGLGVVLNDLWRVIVDLPYKPPHHRHHRERNILNRNSDTRTEATLYHTTQLDADEIWEAGEVHFRRYGLQPIEISSMVEYMQHHGFDALVVRVLCDDQVISTDFTLLDPTGRMGWPLTGYGIFCRWDLSQPYRKLGRHSILKVTDELTKLGYERYDLGACSIPGMGDECVYKNDFISHTEPSMAIFLIDPDDPIIEEYGIDRSQINLIRPGERI